MNIKYKPVIKKRTFNELEEGDIVVFDHNTCGTKDKEILMPVLSVGFTVIHRHKYITFEDKTYLREELDFPVSVVVMEAQKSTTTKESGHNTRLKKERVLDKK